MGFGNFCKEKKKAVVQESFEKNMMYLMAEVFTHERIFQNFPQFIVIHTVKGSGIVNKAVYIHICMDLPGGSDGKASAYNAGDPGSIPGLGRSSGEGNGTPLQYSCLENPRDRGAL